MRHWIETRSAAFVSRWTTANWFERVLLVGSPTMVILGILGIPNTISGLDSWGPVFEFVARITPDIGQWLPGLLIAAGAVLWIVATRLPKRTTPGAVLADRGLRLANHIRACSPQDYRSPTFAFSSLLDHPERLDFAVTVSDHIDRARREQHRNPALRTYTPRRRRQLRQYAEDVARAGRLDLAAELRRWLTRDYRDDDYGQLAIDIYHVADQLHRTSAIVPPDMKPRPRLDSLEGLVTVETTEPQPIRGLRPHEWWLYLRVTNLSNESRTLHAKLVKIEDQQPGGALPPWIVPWRSSSVTEQRIEPGQSAYLELAIADPTNIATAIDESLPDGWEPGHIKFQELRVGSDERVIHHAYIPNDGGLSRLYQREIIAHVMIWESNVSNPAPSITREVVIGFNQDGSVRHGTRH